MTYRMNRVYLSLLGLLLLVLQLTGCQTPPVAKSGLSEKQVAVLQQQGFVLSDDGWSLSFADKLLFDLNSSDLTAKSAAAVERIGKALLSVGLEHLKVDGHTDGVGSDAYNDKLSLARANAVAAMLNQTGITRAYITVRAMGKANPVADNATAAGRAENRRVVIIVLVP
jgi:outer membrane protein OmpA-like peptidoglycan-associated protein